MKLLRRKCSRKRELLHPMKTSKHFQKEYYNTILCTMDSIVENISEVFLTITRGEGKKKHLESNRCIKL